MVPSRDPLGDAAERRRTGPTVLIVEDTASVGEVIETYLDRLDVAVRTATLTDPTMVAEYVAAESVACVVSDYFMPGMDGFEVYEAVLREQGPVPFVIFTGVRDDDIERRAARLDIEYIPKSGPAGGFDALAAWVEEQLSGGRPTAVHRRI